MYNSGRKWGDTDLSCLSLPPSLPLSYSHTDAIGSNGYHNSALNHQHTDTTIPASPQSGIILFSVSPNPMKNQNQFTRNGFIIRNSNLHVHWSWSVLKAVGYCVVGLIEVCYKGLRLIFSSYAWSTVWNTDGKMGVLEECDSNVKFPRPKQLWFNCVSNITYDDWESEPKNMCRKHEMSPWLQWVLWYSWLISVNCPLKTVKTLSPVSRNFTFFLSFFLLLIWSKHSFYVERKWCQLDG